MPSAGCESHRHSDVHSRSAASEGVAQTSAISQFIDSPRHSDVHSRSSAASDLKSGVAQTIAISQFIAASAALRPPRSVRRGLRVSDALVRWRSAFHTNPDRLTEEERAKLHAKSATVEHIDAFISHSWASSGRSKWLALSLEETGAVPMAAAMVITLAMTYIQQTCGLPGDIWATWAPDRVDGDEPSSRVAFSPLVFLSGLVWTFIAALLRLALCRRTYFVDGSCINQVDPEKKLLGIRSIGGFLSLSSQFIVLWDEQYFTRLWCVYELAVFRALNPRRPVLFLPMRFCFAAAVGYFVVLFAVTGVAGLSCGPIFFGDDLDAIVGSPLFYPALVVFWVSAFACCLMTVILGATLERQRSLLQEQLESFDACQAGCSSQADRAEILAAIAGIYEGIGGLDAFNQMVRSPEFKHQVVQILSTRSLVRGRMSFFLIPMVCLMGYVSCAIAHKSVLAHLITYIALVSWLVAGLPLFTALLLERGSRTVGSLARSESSHFSRLLSCASPGRGRLALASCRSATEAVLCMLASVAVMILAMDPGKFGLNASGCVLVALGVHLPLVLGAYCLLVRGAPLPPAPDVLVVGGDAC